MRRAIAALIVGLVAGSLALSPVGAHVGGSVGHMWQDHIRPKVRDDHYTKTQANDRFVSPSELSRSLPLVRSERDGSDDIIFVSNGAARIVNDFSMTVPSSGCLILQGSISIDNDDASLGATFAFAPVVDGDLYAGTMQIVDAPGADAVMGEFEAMSYVTGVPVSAGTHEVDSRVAAFDSNFGAAPYSYSSNNLVATFYPRSRCSAGTSAT